MLQSPPVSLKKIAVAFVKTDNPFFKFLQIVMIRNNIQVELGNQPVTEVMISFASEPVAVGIAAQYTVRLVLVCHGFIQVIIQIIKFKCTSGVIAGCVAELSGQHQSSV